MCRNVEGVMQMFSMELAELDRNTVQLMIDEMQEQIDRQREQLGEKETQLVERDSQLVEKNSQLQDKITQLEEQKKRMQDTIRNSYSKLKDVCVVAEMLGISVEEVEKAI